MRAGQVTAALAILLMLAGAGGCGTAPAATPAGSPSQAVTPAPSPAETLPATVIVKPRQEGIEAMLTALAGADGGPYSADHCWNITPDAVTQDTGAAIYKFDDTCASFALWEGRAFPLGEWFGGLGVMDIQPCDLDGDGTEELLYTYSWGSGLHRSLVGYLDLATGRQTTAGYALYDGDLMLAPGSGGGCSLWQADVTCRDGSLAALTLTPVRKIGDLVWQDGTLTLSPAPTPP